LTDKTGVTAQRLKAFGCTRAGDRAGSVDRFPAPLRGIELLDRKACVRGDLYGVGKGDEAHLNAH
jgi:hypothetical protein